ncbi:uncharacterized protein EV154DRAFT_565133 [Mucor mucedo]|uniref:uncharacterized protein n=1 Tax=Mucor mucedo TaxID=29922 RepID=UPI00221F0F21|nr:uncharacterized protein EV154DRAFT_565133 [Mucor mucedo]KAI7889689.1 hypothetical protein EV154DRAFT_565133 [Mucor mucedo]
MGCCSSSLVDQDLLATSTNDDRSTIPSAYNNKSRPFKRVGLMWTSDIPITETQLEEKRFSYWESAPTYGGRIEIWQALQAAFSETDVLMARSILEAANVLLPTGNPCEGCFDELGNEYNIPIYCVVPPVNLRYNDEEGRFTLPDNKNDSSDSITRHSIYSSNHSEHLVPAPDCSSSPFKIIVRLSTEKDIQLTISSEHETIGSLKTRIYNAKDSAVDSDTHFLRLIYLGKILRDNLSIICEQVEVEDAFSIHGSVRIEADCIIQALVAMKRIN